jgi:nucleoside-diphosphate-sugar epimerase
LADERTGRVQVARLLKALYVLYIAFDVLNDGGIPMKKIVVTGGSGKAGRAVIKELVEHGYDVLNVDLLPPRERLSPYVKTDLTDLGQVFEVLQGADAVVHLGAIPAPGIQPEEPTFRNNIVSTYNVFSAAVSLRLQKVVWASSETTLGLPFEREKPAYAPIDEEHPLYPESSYALSKVLAEEMARQFSRWSGIPFVGLRFSNIMEPQDYERFPSFSKDPHVRKWNLWGYVDARDVAQSCRLALEGDIKGAEVFIIAAADTVMNRPSHELLTEVFPGVPLRGEIGEFETLLSITKARKMLGYHPEYSWRNGS